MSKIKGLVQSLPALRRYGNFITGSKDISKALSMATLTQLTDISTDWPPVRETRINAFHMLSNFLNTPTCWKLAESHADKPSANVLESRLRIMTASPRQAYLLMGMEGFSFKETMLILGVERDQLESWLVVAQQEVAAQVATSVLIIEDEVFIARDLEKIVKNLGHSVIAKVRTRDAARAIISAQRPGLILADIQLADGSNGIDAVNDWLQSVVAVPIIFITAYPDQLLTDERPEPAFLLAKPYHVNEVKAAINQVLFFNTNSTIAPADPRWSIVKLNGLETACSG